MTLSDKLGKPKKTSECAQLLRMRLGLDNHSFATLTGIKYQTLIRRYELNNFEPKEKERLDELYDLHFNK